LEEWFINIVKYGYGDKSEHQIQIGVDFRNNVLRLIIIDDGKPFNPLEYPLPDLQKPLEERKIGGVGLHLIQNLMDTISYSRQNETNILVLEKKVTTVK
jgi:serine/threonine-protein kinase RsbW